LYHGTVLLSYLSNIILAQNMENIPTDVSQWTVANMIYESNNWKLDTLSSLLPMELVNKIRSFPPRDDDGVDERIWPRDSLGHFTVSSAYKLFVWLSHGQK
jgi:hypothetical protein